jgi:hypothetical protein
MMLDFKVSCDHCQVPVFFCMSIFTPFHLRPVLHTTLSYVL